MMAVVAVTLLGLGACAGSRRDDGRAASAQMGGNACVEGSYPACTGADMTWNGQECCLDVAVTCVAGSYPDCTDSHQHWTGAVCCVESPITCVAGSYPDCTDSKQHWTGALCCIEGSVTCDQRGKFDCMGSSDHYTGTQCCSEIPPVEVHAANGQFDPSSVTVARGQTVRWVNTDSEMHTVTSGASSRPSANPGALFDAALAPGDAFEFTFDTPGGYLYFCRFHEDFGMHGVVTVVP
jgi:plastocyanin